MKNIFRKCVDFVMDSQLFVSQFLNLYQLCNECLTSGQFNHIIHAWSVQVIETNNMVEFTTCQTFITHYTVG